MKRYTSCRIETTVRSPDLAGDYNWEEHESAEKAIEAAKRKGDMQREPDVIAWGEAYIEHENGEIETIYSGENDGND